MVPASLTPTTILWMGYCLQMLIMRKKHKAEDTKLKIFKLVKGVLQHTL